MLRIWGPMKNNIVITALTLICLVGVGFQVRSTERWEYKVVSLRIDKNTEQTLIQTAQEALKFSNADHF